MANISKAVSYNILDDPKKVQFRTKYVNAQKSKGLRYNRFAIEVHGKTTL